eukprot:CAMPEP_0113954244 /NCGR_PEP_ID=MMETSP0011_2-20120614/386_1 /TAXON_ID=101924 /ORGANISM="Rhodosorus marinus" /LENGTH=534 /DNA_ID=CAMNT_0000963233 /DNA_START=302 /DNA_END=1906 /DNA_ORIENTATION=- /assembly_acc=CAM_ASM_000156
MGGATKTTPSEASPVAETVPAEVGEGTEEGRKEKTAEEDVEQEEDPQVPQEEEQEAENTVANFDLNDLRERIEGDIITPEDGPAFVEAAVIWNGDWKIRSSPMAIVQVRCTEDVQKSILYAKENKIGIAFRCGGHSMKGLSTSVGGMVIDLGKYMRKVEVDPEKRLVKFQGGCRIKDIDAEATKYDLCTVLGAVGNAGAGGLVSGGGLGHFTRKEGLSVDNVISAEVVCARGLLHNISSDSEPDLFWAIRGGQSNFGCIVSFTMRLFDCPKQILAGMILYDMQYAEKIISEYMQFVEDPDLPRELTVHMYSVPSPSDGKKYVSLLVSYVGPPEEGYHLLHPLIHSAPCVVNQIAPKTYVQHQNSSNDMYSVKGVPTYWKSRNITMGAKIPPKLVVESIEASSDYSILVLEHYGGKVLELSSDATAYYHRDCAVIMSFTGYGYHDEKERSELMEWISKSTSMFEPYYNGTSYMNYDCGSALESFAGNLPRLREIKSIYDPDNIFRCNTNIAPLEDIQYPTRCGDDEIEKINSETN